MCDIDNCETVNDGFGHHAGDEVIRSLARILQARCEHVGRLGGEEFALLLYDASLDQAEQLADAIRVYFHKPASR